MSQSRIRVGQWVHVTWPDSQPVAKGQSQPPGYFCAQIVRIYPKERTAQALYRPDRFSRTRFAELQYDWLLVTGDKVDAFSNGESHLAQITKVLPASVLVSIDGGKHLLKPELIAPQGKES